MQELIIPRRLIQTVYAAAQATPNRCSGGVILQSVNGDYRFQALGNTSETPESLYQPNDEQLDALNDSLNNESILSVLYSRPTGNGEAQTDLDFQQHWVISLNTKGVLELFVWDTSTQPAAAVPQKLKS